MLSIRFQCRTTGAELLYSSVPELRLDGGSMHVADEGQLLIHREGWWRNSENRFLFATIDSSALVSFECGQASSTPYGPFSQITFVNGSIWVVSNRSEMRQLDAYRKQLLARFIDTSDKWADFESNEWSSVRIHTPQHSNSTNGDLNHATERTKD